MKTKKYVIGVFALVLALFLNLRYAANGYGIGKNIPLMVAVASDSDEPIPGGEYQEEVSYVVGNCTGYIFKVYSSTRLENDWRNYMSLYSEPYPDELTKSYFFHYPYNDWILLFTITSSKESEFADIKQEIDSANGYSMRRAQKYIQTSEPYVYTSMRITCNPGGTDVCTPSFYEWCRANSDSGLEPTDSSSELQNIIDAIR